MSWIDTTVVVIIVGGALFILYKAIKEPLDLLFGFIGRGLRKVKDMIVDAKDTGGDYYEEIRYS